MRFQWTSRDTVLMLPVLSVVPFPLNQFLKFTIKPCSVFQLFKGVLGSVVKLFSLQLLYKRAKLAFCFSVGVYDFTEPIITHIITWWDYENSSTHWAGYSMCSWALQYFCDWNPVWYYFVYVHLRLLYSHLLFLLPVMLSSS